VVSGWWLESGTFTVFDRELYFSTGMVYEIARTRQTLTTNNSFGFPVLCAFAKWLYKGKH